MTIRETVLSQGFWCLDTVFRQVDGVVDAISSYANGQEDPNNKEFCIGTISDQDPLRRCHD